MKYIAEAQKPFVEINVSVVQSYVVLLIAIKDIKRVLRANGTCNYIGQGLLC